MHAQRDLLVLHIMKNGHREQILYMREKRMHRDPQALYKRERDKRTHRETSKYFTREINARTKRPASTVHER